MNAMPATSAPAPGSSAPGSSTPGSSTPGSSAPDNPAPAAKPQQTGQGNPGRILIAKPGLDGHDRGAKYVAHILRDAGYEVIYTGIRRTPEQIVHAAVQEDVKAIGLSLLSGAHNVLFKKVLDLLKQQGAADIIVFGGGVIPEADIPGLKQAGLAAVFTPGTPAKTITQTLEALFAAKV